MLKSSLSIRNKLRNKSDIAESLEELAKMNSFGGEFERATRLFAAASVLREQIYFTMTPTESSESDRDLSTLCSKLGSKAFTVSWDEGRTMPWGQAVILVLTEAPI